MKYARQSESACLAYALLQIGAVSRNAVREYERELKRIGGRPNWQCVGRWLCKHSEPLANVLMRNGGCCPNWGVKRLPKGRGVLIVDHFDGNHAISFESGMVLDPSPNAPGKPESLKELKLRYWRKEGSALRLLAAIEV